MGGLAVHTSKNTPGSERFLPIQNDVFWFLNDTGLRTLMKLSPDEVPNLTEAEIQSKSKANVLAKALTCIQALWFIAQCITRSQRIPISLLELNTFGHAFCALLIYLLWWEKPLDVDFPTIVHGETLRKLCALHWIVENDSSAVTSVRRHCQARLNGVERFQAYGKKLKQYILLYPMVEADLITLSHYDDLISKHEKHTPYERTYYGELLEGFDAQQQNRNCNLDCESESRHDGNEDGVSLLKLGETLQGTDFQYRPRVGPGRSDKAWYGLLPFFPQGLRDNPMEQERFDIYTRSYLQLPNISLSAEGVTRWRMASDVNRAFGALNPAQQPGTFNLRHGLMEQKHLERRREDWPGSRQLFNDPFTIFGFCAAAFVYGGLHALAWSAHFETFAEQTLWRLSACIVMGGLPIYTILVVIVNKIDESGLIRRLSMGVLTSSVLILLIAYVLARGYLVVECFINLFHLPAGVYNEPTWSIYVPHIS
ncbi:MAG: hypothetical protein Q9213_005716 [Squamulea squamosa]